MTRHTFPKLFHVLKSGTSIPYDDFSPKPAFRGEEFIVTEEIYEASKDRNGVSRYDMTPEEQIERYGFQRWGEGPAPDSIKFIGDDDATVIFRRRENAVIAARRIEDPAERKKAFDDIVRLYGSPESSQRSNTYAG